MMTRVGQLLIAHPNIPAANPFSKSVIYIFADNEEGVQGIMLNKPTKYTVNGFMESRGFEMHTTREYMRFGGPVSSKLIFLLHTDDWDSSSSYSVGKGLKLSCDTFMLEKMSFGFQPSLWRMAVGICAWQPGQLEMELEGKKPYRPENSWLVADASDSIIFEHDKEKQWERALELSRNQMIANFF